MSTAHAGSTAVLQNDQRSRFDVETVCEIRTARPGLRKTTDSQRLLFGKSNEDCLARADKIGLRICERANDGFGLDVFSLQQEIRFNDIDDSFGGGVYIIQPTDSVLRNFACPAETTDGEDDLDSEIE